jgi:putative hydrolase of the HAD superfamily
MRRFDAVFLDAQGTLLRAHPSVAGIYSAVCRRFYPKVAEARVAAAVRQQWEEFKASPEAQKTTYDTSEEATRAWWATFNTRVFQRLGLKEGLEAYLEALWEVFGSPESWRLFPEVEEVLAALRERGYRLGIVSNWDSRLLLISERLGLTPYLDFLLASAATGMEKPDSRIFHLALARAGVEADRALHVGDDYEADFLGARAAGLEAVLIDREGILREGVPTLPSLRGLLEILA